MLDKKYTIHFETLGCKVNQIESESIARSFSDAGFLCTMGGLTSKTTENEDIIVSIINTCTVTGKAEQKARRLIRLMTEKYPKAVVIVTGCYAELDKVDIEKLHERICVVKGTQKDLLASLPQFIQSKKLDSIDTLRLTKDCANFFDATQKKLSLTQKKRSFILSTDTFLQHSRPSIKIQDGCNWRCTYCRICLARGESVSLSAQEVLERVLVLEKAGHAEVVITGINLSLYRSENEGFVDLLSYLLNNTSKISFRLSSLHPQMVTEKLCAVLSHNRVRNHFHLSVQSGSDEILHAMARPYKAVDVQTAVDRLRSVKDNPFIACDIIVGFPGETDVDFEKTILLSKNANFTWVHAFPFSARPETKAYDMEPKVPQNISNERVRLLTNLAIAQKTAYIESCFGKTFTGIVEKHRKNDIHIVTENFIHLKVDPKTTTLNANDLGGKEVLVMVESVNTNNLSQAVGEASGKILSVL